MSLVSVYFATCVCVFFCMTAVVKFPHFSKQNITYISAGTCTSEL